MKLFLQQKKRKILQGFKLADIAQANSIISLSLSLLFVVYCVVFDICRVSKAQALKAEETCIILHDTMKGMMHIIYHIWIPIFLSSYSMRILTFAVPHSKTQINLLFLFIFILF